MTDQPEPLAPAAPAAVPPTRTAPVGSALPGVDRAAPPSRDERSENARRALLAVRAEVAKAVVGQDAAVAGLLVGLLCRGHVLLEGVPGVAKTLLVRSLAAALDVETKRVQFTPDLMPGDVTGSLVYDAAARDFTFRQGPVFTNLLLADEINRTPPKTQSSLLEAMEERQVSRSTASRTRCPRRSWWPPPRTPSSTRAPTRCPRRSSTGSCSRSCCRCPSATTRCRCCAGTRAGSTRATSPRPASGPWHRRRPRRRRRGGARGRDLRRGRGLHRRHRPGHPGVALARPGRLARAAPPR